MIQKNVSLALQVLNDISSGMESGELLRQNGQLPSEEELSKRYHVSRATVREALSRLEQRGSVVRHHGKGTFATSSRRPLVIDAGLEQLESIDTMARRIGLETQAGAAEIIERVATPQEQKQLQITDNGQVLVISRLILANGKPVAYLVDVVPTDFLRANELEPIFKGSVLDVLLRRANPLPSQSLTDITFETVEHGIGHKLNLKSTDIIFKLESLMFSIEGLRMCYSFSYFIPGYFRFHVVRRVNPIEFYSQQ